MIPLTVVIGVGGMGSRVAVRVQEHLLELARERDRAQGNTYEYDRVRQYTRIFAVDTWSDIDDLDATNTKIVTPVDVDRTIAVKMKSLQEGGDTNFQQWWPPEQKFLGSFIQGAGALRIKGKYAFYEAGWPIARQFGKAINDLLDVRALTKAPTQPVFVFMVGSLSGGTGSGIMLPLALHLREVVTNENVKFIGAIALGSVMEKATAGAFTDKIWGNCSAALRELEWWMTSEHRRPEQIRPYLQRGLEAITGDERPFDLCYLFTSQNRAGKQISKTYRDYAKLIADAIALDLNSDAATQAQGSLSNFLTIVNEERERPPVPTGADPRTIASKPVTFGSVSAASIEYAVTDITRFLGLRLLDTVMGSYLLTRPNLGTAARDWAASEHVGLTASQIAGSLRTAWTNPTTRERKDPPIRRDIVANGNRSQDRQQAVSDAQGAKNNFDQNILPTLQELIGLNASLVEERARDAAREKIESLMASTGDGFGIARQFVADLAETIARWKLDVQEMLNAPLPTNQPNAERFPAATRALLLSQHPGRIGEIRNGKGSVKDAVARYNGTWWQPYGSACEHIAVLSAADRQYDLLLSMLTKMKEAFDIMTGTLTDAWTRNTDTAEVTLGGIERRMMLEERVLDDARLVEAVFGERLAQERRSGDGSPVADIAKRMVAGAGEHDGYKDGLIAILRGAAKSPVAGREPINVKELTDATARRGLEAAEMRFRADVEELSIWRALRLEAIHRHRLSMRDEALGIVLASGTQLEERDLVRRYIEQRVKHCLESAAPCWLLDASRIDQGRYPIKRDGLLWYSLSSLEGLSKEDAQSIVDIVAAVAGNAVDGTVQAQQDVGSKYRILAMQREAGATLSMLDQAERRNLENGERAYSTVAGTAYTDIRFVDQLPHDFELSSVQVIMDRNHGARQSETLEANRKQPGQRNNGTGPLTIFRLTRMLNDLIEQGVLTEEAKGRYLRDFGSILRSVESGIFKPADADEAAAELLAELPQPVRA